MKKSLFVGAVTLVAALWMQNASAELVVVTNASAKFSTLKQSQLTRLFLGQSNSLPDGSAAIPFDVSGERNTFYNEVLKKAPEQLEKYWARMIFTGKAQMPRQVAPRDIKSTVAETPGAISYIERSAVDASVKVIAITAD